MPEKETQVSEMRGEYQRRMLEIRDAFAAGASGAETIAARARAMDELIRGLWAQAVEQTPKMRSGIAVLALVLFLLTFTPIPIAGSLIDVIKQIVSPE